MLLISALAATASVAITTAELRTSTRPRSALTWLTSPQTSLSCAPRPESITPTTSQSLRPNRILCPIWASGKPFTAPRPATPLVAPVCDPPPARQLGPPPHFNAGRHDAAYREVHAVGVIDIRQVDNSQHLE